MAFNFVRANSQYFQIDQAPVTAVPITISCFFNSIDDTVGQAAIHIVDKSTENNGFSMLVAGNLGGDPLRAFVWTPGGTLAANSTTGYTTGTWHHGTVVFESSTIVHAYIDGGSKGSTTGIARTPTGINRIKLGGHGDSSPGAYFDGDLCEVGVWNTNLTDSEIASLSQGFSPLFIRPQSLVFYTPMVDTLGGYLNDMIGGLRLSPFSSPTKSKHYRIIMPHHLQLGLHKEIDTKLDNITLFLQAQNDIDDNINLYIQGHEIIPHRKIFFSDYAGGIYICNLDGSVIEEIIDTDADPCYGLDIDHTSDRKIYYTLLFADHIKRANLDGTNQEVLVTSSSGVDGPQSLIFSHELNRIYWSEAYDVDIHYSDSDGENVVDTDVDGRFTAIDLTRNKLYIVGFTASTIRKCNFDGSNVETIADGLGLVLTGIYYYLKTDKIYWCDNTNGKIQASGLSGGSVEDLVTTGLDAPWGLYIDEIEDKIYFTDVDNENIKRCNLDGSNVKEIIPSGFFTLPYTIAIDNYQPAIFMITHGHTNINNNISLYLNVPEQATDEIVLFIEGCQSINNNIDLFIYGHQSTNNDIDLYIHGHEKISSKRLFYSDDGSYEEIRSISLGGGDEYTLVDSLSLPRGVAVNPNENKVYFIDDGTNNIQKINFDGTNLKTIITGLIQPIGIDVDYINTPNKIYFSDFNTNLIQRADLNGDHKEIIVDSSSGVSLPAGLVLDLNNNKIYWLNDKDIFRSDLNGENVETIVSGENQPWEITIDSVNQKLYWTDNSPAKIRRCNFDGSDVETFITYGSVLRGLVFDVEDQYIYVGDDGNDEILRINLNGIVNTIYSISGVSSFGDIDLGIQPVNLSINGFQTINNNIELLIIGHQNVTNNIPFVTIGKETFNDDIPLFINGFDSITDNIPLFVVGHNNINNDVNLFIQGHVAPTNNINLFVYGFDQINNDVDLIIIGYESINNNVVLFINSHSPINNNIDLFIGGRGSATNQIDLFAHGHQTINNNITFWINGYSTLNNDIVLFVATHETHNNNINLFINGFKSITDNIPLTLVGHVDSNNNIELFITSHQQITDSVPLFISSFDQITNNIPLFIWGHDRVLHQKLYTLDSANGDILISDLDGNFLEILLENEFTNAFGIDVDQVNGKIYWTENVNNNISRANLDGTSVEIIVPTSSGIDGPGAISVCPALNRIYWIDGNGKDLKRANLDGTNVEVLIDN